MKRLSTKLRKRRRGRLGGGGGGVDVGPMRAVPAPTGVPAVEAGVGVFDCASVGVGGTLGAEDAGISVCAVVETVEEIGPVGTPATV